MSLIGLASHQAGSPAGDHPAVNGRALLDNSGETIGGAINARIRDSTGSIRVLADVYPSEVQAAIDRWNTKIGRTVFTRVTSGSWELRVRNRAASECPALAGFNAFFLTDPAGCGVVLIGAPDFTIDTPAYILINPNFGLLSVELRTTGLVHEMGHDLGIRDHYFSAQTPVCRSDVVSIMENWGCSGGNPTDHDQFDVGQAYLIYGRPQLNYIWPVNASSGEFRVDTLNAWDRSLHNEQKTQGLRVRVKDGLEGTVLSSKHWDRQATNSYTSSFGFVDGERCRSANGNNKFVVFEGPDGPEACAHRMFVESGWAIGTTATRIDLDTDFVRLHNLTWLTTITNARLTHTNGNFISWVTQYGQPNGQIITNGYGLAAGLDLPKGNYWFRFDVETLSFIMPVGLDDNE